MPKIKKCKICGSVIENPRPLQNVCSPKCAIELTKQKKAKAHRKERLEKLPELYPRKYKSLLQSEINKLARMIDAELGFNTCIDCGTDLRAVKQIDGSHFHNVGSHPTARYNLHNIHSSSSKCNKYDGGNKEGYKKGIIERYSSSYLERIEALERLKMDKLSNKEIADKLKLVRKLIRDFDTCKITDGIKARDLFNNLIGIYK